MNHNDDNGQEQQCIEFPFSDFSQKVNDAATEATRLVDKYSDRNLPEWQHPEQVFREITDARDAVSEAWEKLLEAIEEKKAPPVTDQDFRVVYMDMITEAFGDCLHNLQQNPDDPVDVDILVECLQSGMDFMTKEEKDLLMQEHSGELEIVEGNRSIHDIRREMWGYGTSTSD